MRMEDRGRLIREAIGQLRRSEGEGHAANGECSTSAPYEVVSGLLASATSAEQTDFVYETVAQGSSDLLLEQGDYEALAEVVDLLKRTLLRYIPTPRQLERTGGWCQRTVERVQHEESEGENSSTQKRELVNSLKFLRRFVGRKAERAAVRAERTKAASPSGSGDEGIGDGGGVGTPLQGNSSRPRECYPHSALDQLRSNADSSRRRSSTQEALTRSGRSRTNLSLLSNATAISTLPEKEQNDLFGDLLRHKGKSIAELSRSVKLALAHMVDMYEKDAQQTFVILSIFMQEMLLENDAELQCRAFDIFLNLFFHWQVLESRQRVREEAKATKRAPPAQQARKALALRDAMWHATLLNEMCLVLLDCGGSVDQQVWASAHSCLLFCCAQGGVLVPKLVKLVSAEVLRELFKVCLDCKWTEGRESSIVAMMVSHVLPHRGNHLGVDAHSLAVVGGEKWPAEALERVSSPASRSSLVTLAYYMAVSDLNGPGITLGGDHMMNTRIPALEGLLEKCDFSTADRLRRSLRRQDLDGNGVVARSCAKLYL